MTRGAIVAFAALFATAASPVQSYSLFDPVPDDKLRPLCADRPGKATPPCILDAGHVQVEVGLVDALFVRDNGVNANQYAIAATVLRLGLGPTTEALVSWTPLIVSRIDGRSRTDVGDLTFGIKQSLHNPDGTGFSVAVQALAVAPTASGASGWEGQFALPVALGAGDFTLSFTPEVDVVPNASGTGSHTAVSGVVAVGHAIGPIAAGIELWTARDNDPDGHATATTLDLTAAWIPNRTPNWQIDGGVNFGLGGSVGSTEAYFGISHRF